MAPHSRTLAWKIPQTEEPGRLQSVGSKRVGHDWATSLSLFTCMHWRRKWNPLQCSCLENPRDRGAWWAAVYGVTQSQTRVKWLSSRYNKSYTWDYFILHRFFITSSVLVSVSELWCVLQTHFCFPWGRIQVHQWLMVTDACRLLAFLSVYSLPTGFLRLRQGF